MPLTLRLRAGSPAAPHGTFAKTVLWLVPSGDGTGDSIVRKSGWMWSWSRPIEAREDDRFAVWVDMKDFVGLVILVAPTVGELGLLLMKWEGGIRGSRVICFASSCNRDGIFGSFLGGEGGSGVSSGEVESFVWKCPSRDGLGSIPSTLLLWLSRKDSVLCELCGVFTSQSSKPSSFLAGLEGISSVILALSLV